MVILNMLYHHQKDFSGKKGIKGIDYNKKDDFQFISLIRLLDFVTKKDFEWALEEATCKKK